MYALQSLTIFSTVLSKLGHNTTPTNGLYSADVLMVLMQFSKHFLIEFNRDITLILQTTKTKYHVGSCLL